MKFVWSPTDGALIPHLYEQGKEAGQEAVQQAINDIIISWTKTAALWTAHNGVPIIAEFVLVWGMICFLFAIAGKGKWLERGTKAVLLSVMLGMVKYAV